nr:hypothetical protein Iba_chr02bCG6060 [Ipomoea batatas]
MPIIARGKPYVSINADHSDPGMILKYAKCTYERSEIPTPSPTTPNEICRQENPSSLTTDLSEEVTEEG